MSERLFSVMIRAELPNGFTIDVHSIVDGQVWYQRWKPGVEQQSVFDDLGRMPVAEFNEAMTTACADCRGTRR